MLKRFICVLIVLAVSFISAYDSNNTKFLRYLKTDIKVKNTVEVNESQVENIFIKNTINNNVNTHVHAEPSDTPK